MELWYDNHKILVQAAPVGISYEMFSEYSKGQLSEVGLDHVLFVMTLTCRLVGGTGFKI
jgi:hypothetical protein